MFVGDWMGRGALYWPERTAVVDVARGAAGRFTYQQMSDRADALAAFLRETARVGPGDRVGLVAHNGVEYLDLFFACARLGAIFVPFNWRLHANELGQLFRDTSPRAIFFGEEFEQLTRDAAKSGAPESFLTSVDAWRPHPDPLPRGEGIRNEKIREDDTVCLLFTGGTTGKSRGARISYKMIAWNTLNTLIHELRPGDVTITHTPMFHTGGLLVYTLPLLTVGGTVVIQRRWDPDALLDLIPREKVTVFFAVPSQYQQLYDSPKLRTTDFSTVRYMTSGGAPLPVQLIEAWRKIHPTPFKQGFGMTEAGPGLFSMGPEHAISRAGSIGRPNYTVDAKLVDDDGREVPIGEAGELVLKGPTIFSGYFGDESASHAAFDKDGWFHTGDVARRDADGFFFIVDRKKDMFISGGENVFPVEVEQVLYTHAAVRQCAVVGVPDAKWGETGVAFVVLKPDARATEAELLEHARAHLARYKVPRKVELRTELPLSPAGKILKRELRAAWLSTQSPSSQSQSQSTQSQKKEQ